MPHLRSRHVAALAVAVLTLTACAGTDSDGSNETSAASSTTSTQSTSQDSETPDTSDGSDGSDAAESATSTTSQAAEETHDSAGSTGSGDEDDQDQAEGTASSTSSGDGSGDGDSSEGRLYDVVRVVDGDTVEVAINGGESIRVIGIDTPETVHPSVPDECGGQAASNAAKDLLSGQQVRVVFDPSQGKRDTYDRMLAYLEIPGTGDFGEIMLRRGHAAEYTYQSAYERQVTYRSAEQQARSADKGLWGTCGGTDVPAETASPTPTPETTPTPSPATTPETPPTSAPEPAPQTGGGGGNPASKANAPGPGWTNDTLTPGYSGCRQGYPGGRIDGVYWWKPISC